MLVRHLALLFGAASYLIAVLSVLYAIGFVGNFLVPKSIDSGVTAPLGEALAVNLALVGLFALQHSGMARPAFKKWWTRIVPRPLERSTYVLLSALLLLLLFCQWRPMPAPVWHVESAVGVLILSGLFWLGWLILLASTFMIDHFDFLGLKQTWCWWRDREYRPPDFKEAWFYRYVRHPIMLGFLISFWATPSMSVGHLLLATASTAYIFAGIFLEERDLLRLHGEAYQAYRRRTGMLIPWRKK